MLPTRPHLKNGRTAMNESNVTEEILTSAEMRRFPRFRRQTPVGDCTSSEDVPDAWSLSPSDPIFRFSWTISGAEKDGTMGQEVEQVLLS